MNHLGMKYSLASRELIADSVEVVAQAHAFDALVLIPNCDKIIPGMLMAAARLNLPSIVVSGGPMLAGSLDGRAVDLAVLATSLIPRPGTADLARILGIEVGSYGFIKTEPFSPMDTTRQGIFAAGCCRGPFDIPESVMQASAAAARAARFVETA